MTNYEKYVNAFAEAFEADPEAVKEYAMGVTAGWDSIGHMSLIAALEDGFEIELEPDEMLGINSFETGMEVLSKKGIEF